MNERDAADPKDPVSAAKRCAPRPRRTMRIPVGIEKLLYLAAYDPAFRQELIEARAAAVERSGNLLRDSELAVLTSVSDAQLAAMIARIDVKRHSKRDFMRAVASVALAAATTGALMGCKGEGPTTNTNPSEVVAPTDSIDVYQPPPPPAGIPPEVEVEMMPPPNAGMPARDPGLPVELEEPSPTRGTDPN